jgi:hypothetical protein
MVNFLIAFLLGGWIVMMVRISSLRIRLERFDDFVNEMFRLRRMGEDITNDMQSLINKRVLMRVKNLENNNYAVSKVVDHFMNHNKKK